MCLSSELEGVEYQKELKHNDKFLPLLNEVLKNYVGNISYLKNNENNLTKALSFLEYY